MRKYAITEVAEGVEALDVGQSTESCKKLPAKFSEKSSVWADAPCTAGLGQWAAGTRQISHLNKGIFLHTSVQIRKYMNIASSNISQGYHEV